MSWVVDTNDVESLTAKFSRFETWAPRPEGYDFVVTSLGFEERALAVPLRLQRERIRVDTAVIVEYPSRRISNEENREPLQSAFRDSTISWIPSTKRTHGAKAARAIRDHEGEAPRVLFDISSSSSVLLLPVLRAILDTRCYLEITYSEPARFLPTKDKVDDVGGIENWVDKHMDETIDWWSTGVGDVYPCPGMDASHDESLPAMAVVFAGMRQERSLSTLQHISADLPDDQSNQCWVWTKPSQDSWRIDLQKELHKEVSDRESKSIDALDYGKVVIELDHIWKKNRTSHNLWICPLGTKVHCVGVALFHLMRPVATVFLSEPEQYHGGNFSEGVGRTLGMTLGDTQALRTSLREVDHLLIREDGGEPKKRWSPLTNFKKDR